MGEPRPLIKEPEISRDTKKFFNKPRIVKITREVPTLLEEIPANIDDQCPVLKFDDVKFNEKFIWTKNLIPELINAVNEEDPEKNIFGGKYFDRVEPVLAADADGNVRLEVYLVKMIDGAQFRTQLKIIGNDKTNCDEVNFEIKKIMEDGQKVNFNSNYRVIRPKYGDGGVIQPGKVIFRPYADPEKYPGRVPKKVSFTRVPKVPVVNYLKDLKELLPIKADKELVKVDAPYEIIETLINKLRPREGSSDYDKFLKVLFGLQTEERFCKHINGLKDRYKEYLKAGIKERTPDTNEEIILPIEELSTFDKRVELGNDYIHPNQVRDIKRLARLDTRFVLTNITEIQQKLIDIDGRTDYVEKTFQNGYPKLIINVEQPNKYWPVDYGFFTPFTFTDLLTTKVGVDYFKNAIGVTSANYRSWFGKMEEFKSKSLTFVSLYYMLTLKASKYISITDENRTEHGLFYGEKKYGNTKNIDIVEFELPKFYPGKDYTDVLVPPVRKEVCFFSHFAQEDPATVPARIPDPRRKGKTIMPSMKRIIPEQKLFVSNTLSVDKLINPIPGTKIVEASDLRKSSLVFLQVIEGSVDTQLEKFIVTGDVENETSLASKLLGETIENINEGESYEFNDEDFEPLVDPEIMDELICRRLEEQKARIAEGRKTFAQLAFELEGSNFGVLPKVPMFTFKTPKRKIIDEFEEDDDFQVAEVDIGSGSRGEGGVTVDPCKLDQDNNPIRRRTPIKDIIEDPLRCLRIEEAESIWRRMPKKLKIPVKGLTRTDKIEQFFIKEKTEELEKIGVKEEDMQFRVSYAWFLLLGKEYVKKILKNYLILLQKDYNKSFQDEDLVKTKRTKEGDEERTPYYTKFAKFSIGDDEYNEQELCDKFLDGIKSRTDEIRAEGLKIALKFIEHFDKSEYAKQAILDFMKSCDEREYTDYMKQTYRITDDEVPPCQGGERIRARGGVRDMLEIDDKGFTSSDLEDVGINPTIPEAAKKTHVLDEAAYKTRMRVLLSQVIRSEKKLGDFVKQKKEKKQRDEAGKSSKRAVTGVEFNDDFINGMFESLSKSKFMSMKDVIEGRTAPRKTTVEGEEVIDADKTDVLEYNLGSHNDNKLGKVIIKNDGRDAEYSSKIRRILKNTNYHATHIAKGEEAKETKMVESILATMKDKKTSFAEALDMVEAAAGKAVADIGAINAQALQISRNNKGLSKELARRAAEIMITRSSQGKRTSEADAVAVAKGRKTLESLGGGYGKYIKYKAKYLSLVSKLGKLGINI